MKRFIFLIIFLCASFHLFPQYSVTGGNGIPHVAEEDVRNHLKVYLLNSLQGAQISFTSAGSELHNWYKYKEKALEASPVACVQNGNTSWITDIEDECGYFTGSPTDPETYFIWIADYSLYVPRFFSLEVQEEEDKCSFLKITADVEAEPIVYYLPSGAPVNLARNYHLKYHTQKWDEDMLAFLPQSVDLELKGIITEITIDAPLANTDFTLTGDDFAGHFGMEQTIRSAEYQAIAVEAHGKAVTDKEHADNEVHNSGTVLGGSAPIDYTFTAYANEPVAAFYIWKVMERDSITGAMSTLLRYTDKVLRRTFDREGTFVVQLEVIDSKSVCVDTTQIFPISIGRTYIKIPRAFSPGSSIGINDELKIAYTSITSFKASIFNRWGKLLYQWTDPSKGWDGRVSGKFVPTGAYYIIVEYTNSRGEKCTVSQDVNILRAKE
ncbi:MAG: gliding motility-associated C-terminal domain-containing protein [Candidatus Symbiothrix sp.]|jgi:gliding motility-associated-like protein|nr:gliding motility-associated C-terminal domain-containing protein [Candidatus Symbiothrix sp.]